MRTATFTASEPSVSVAHQVLFNLEMFENILVQAPRGTPKWQSSPDGSLSFNPEGTESMRTILRLQRVCKFFSTVIRHSRPIQRRLFRLPGPVKDYVCNCGISDEPCTTELNPLLANLLNRDDCALEFRCVARAEGRRLRYNWPGREFSTGSLFEDRHLEGITIQPPNAEDTINNTSEDHEVENEWVHVPILRFAVRRSSRFANMYTKIHRREEVREDGQHCTYIEHEPLNQTWETMYFTYPPVCAERHTVARSGDDHGIMSRGNMTVEWGLQAKDTQGTTREDFYKNERIGIRYLSLSQWLSESDEEECREQALWSSGIMEEEEEAGEEELGERQDAEDAARR